MGDVDRIDSDQHPDLEVALGAGIDRLVAIGVPAEDAAHAIAALVDDLVDLEVLVPGPAGKLLETVDEPLIRRVSRWLLGLVSPDPKRRAERKLRRDARRAERRRRRGAQR